MKVKPAVVSLFFSVFPSDFIPAVTKEIVVHLFIQSSNSFKLYQQIRAAF